MEDDDGRPIALGGRAAAAVVGHLTLAQGLQLSIDAVIDRIWDNPPDSARNALHVAVSKLRKALGAELIAGGRDGYRSGRT